jgi:hypothetical protein
MWLSHVLERLYLLHAQERLLYGEYNQLRITVRGRYIRYAYREKLSSTASLNTGALRKAGGISDEMGRLEDMYQGRGRSFGGMADLVL